MVMADLTKIKISQVTLTDVSHLAAMEVEFSVELDEIDGKKRNRSLRRYQQRYRLALSSRPPHFHALIARYRGKVAGHLIYVFNYSTSLAVSTIFVESLFVRNRFRKHGVGRQLMQALQAEAKKNKCKLVHWTVWNLNPKALAFYLSIGAKPVNDDIIMKVDVK